MSEPPFDYRRYLAAKKGVDDRALNLHVLETVRQVLAARPGLLRVLDVGCGAGVMLERLLDCGLLNDADYYGLDQDAGLLAEARLRLGRYGRSQGWQCREEGGTLILAKKQKRVRLTLVAADLYRFCDAHPRPGPFDFLVAHHFLDLVNLDRALPKLFSLVRPGGLFWFTLNYDGATVFLPPFRADLDRRIEVLYHQTMERADTAAPTPGACHTGRRLFAAIPAAGGDILAAGGSAWVVRPDRGRYAGDEAYFLHAIVGMVEGALMGHAGLEAQDLQAWLTARRGQIDAGELIFMAHQLDFCGRVNGLEL